MNELVEIPEPIEDQELLSSEAKTQQEQYLSFSLGDETFAVNILSVQEIRTWETPTRLPRSPSYLKGVINLRGTIMPIIDLRIKLEICEPHYTDTTVVIILSKEHRGKKRGMGVVVDAMTDVVHIPQEEVKSPPEFGGKIDALYIDGLAVVDNSIVSILNIAELIDVENIEHSLRSVAEK